MATKWQRCLNHELLIFFSFVSFFPAVNNGQVPTSAQAQGNHTYAISFVPKEAKPHVVELKFNGENVPGSPFRCAIVDAAKVNLSGDGLEKVS